VLNVKIVCAHKGIPFDSFSYGFGRDDYKRSTAHDVGSAARMFPGTTFIIYHGGYDPEVREGAYDPGKAYAGINALVKQFAEMELRPTATSMRRSARAGAT